MVHVCMCVCMCLHAQERRFKRQKAILKRNQHFPVPPTVASNVFGNLHSLHHEISRFKAIVVNPILLNPILKSLRILPFF